GLSSLRPPFSLSLERLVTTLTEEADLAGVDRSLWAVEIPEAAYPKPNLLRSTLLGGLLTYTDCQDEARRLRQGGAQCLEAPSAALLPRGARGWVAMPNIQAPLGSRSGKVWMWFGARPDFVAWPAVEGGTPPSRILPLVRHLTFSLSVSDRDVLFYRRYQSWSLSAGGTLHVMSTIMVSPSQRLTNCCLRRFPHRNSSTNSMQRYSRSCALGSRRR